MDERSYSRVANTLNQYGVWTSWCSQFLTEAGIKLIGMDHLERSLRSAGYNGGPLEWHSDVDPGSGFGYGNALIDASKLKESREPHEKICQRAIRDHVTEHHMSYVLEGKRTFCLSHSPIPH